MDTDSINIVRNEMNNTKESVFHKVGSFFSKQGKNAMIIRTILSVLLLTVFVGAGVYLVQRVQNLRSSASGVTLSLSSNISNPQVGDNFTVAVGMDAGSTSISAATIQVTYDPKLLQVDSVANGGYLPVTLGTPDNSPGVATINVGCNLGDPKSGTGILAIIKFTAKENGTANITFASNTAVAEIGQNSNAAGTLNPVQVIIGSSSTPTQSPESSTPVPTPTTEQPTVDHWTKTTKTDQVESCSDYTGKCGTKTITTITGVKIYGLNFGSGPVNVRIIDTNGHTYQGTSSVAQESGFDTATAPYNSLTAVGFNTSFNDINSWNVTVSK